MFNIIKIINENINFIPYLITNLKFFFNLKNDFYLKNVCLKQSCQFNLFLGFNLIILVIKSLKSSFFIISENSIFKSSFS